MGLPERGEERDRARFAAFREFAAEHRDDPRVRDRLAYLEARILQRAGKHAAAAENLADLVSRDRTRPEPLLRLAECLRAKGDPADAAERLRVGLEANPGDRSLWTLWSAISLADLGRSPAELIEALDRVTGGPSRPEEASEESERTNFRWLLERIHKGEPIRINSGGGEYTSAEGVTWVGDRFMTRGNQHGAGEAFAGEIANTGDDALYQTNLWFPAQDRRPAGYRIPLVPGSYRVTLHFAEVTFKNEGVRTFDVRIEGKRGLEENDPIAAGFATAVRQGFVAEVNDGLLEIDFDHVRQNPMISAVEIERLE